MSYIYSFFFISWTTQITSPNIGQFLFLHGSLLFTLSTRPPVVFLKTTFYYKGGSKTLLANWLFEMIHFALALVENWKDFFINFFCQSGSCTDVNGWRRVGGLVFSTERLQSCLSRLLGDWNRPSAVVFSPQHFTDRQPTLRPSYSSHFSLQLCSFKLLFISLHAHSTFPPAAINFS